MNPTDCAEGGVRITEELVEVERHTRGADQLPQRLELLAELEAEEDAKLLEDLGMEARERLLWLQSRDFPSKDGFDRFQDGIDLQLLAKVQKIVAQGEHGNLLRDPQ